MKKILVFIGVVFMTIQTGQTMASDSISTEEIIYQSAGVQYTGYVARPKGASGKLPAVLVVHEWWGQTDYPRTRAVMLAKLGYIAMAVDMYGGRQIADHPNDAGTFAQAVMSDSATVLNRFSAALSSLKSLKGVDTSRVAAIGYCFGGSVVLDMAKQGVDLRGVVSFHGGLQTPTPAKKGMIRAKMLVLNGADDKMISAEQVKAFESQISAASGDLEVVNYPHAQHGFTNPGATELGKKLGIAIAYEGAADKASWSKMQDFLKVVFE